MNLLLGFLDKDITFILETSIVVSLTNLKYILQEVHLHLLDMSEPKKVVEFAKEFESSGKPLHVLVCISLIHSIIGFQHIIMCQRVVVH